MLMIVLFTLILMIGQSNALTSKTIQEHQLYQNIKQTSNSWAYYKVTIGSRYYKNQVNMIVRVIADTFLSDPDVYISKKNQFPTSSVDAEWHCKMESSDTCVIEHSKFRVGDTFNIGVHCQRECGYKLKIWLQDIYTLPDSDRTQMRWTDYSTQLMRYYIPGAIKRIGVEYVIIKIIPEEPYSKVDMYLSLDPSFSLLQDQLAVQVLEDGIALRFTKSDINWCSKCYIYLLANVEKEQRYYVTTKAFTKMPDLSQKVPKEITVNPFQQNCYGYFVLRIKEDVAFYVEEFRGHADLYITTINPSVISIDKFILFTDARGPNRAIILDRYIREWFNQRTGNYFLCFYATTPFSAKVSVNEFDFAGIYDFFNNQIVSVPMKNGNTVVGKYINSDLSKEAYIYVYAEGQEFSENDIPPQVFYKICDKAYAECKMSDEEKNGGGAAKSVGVKMTTGIRTGYILHNPKQCFKEDDCTYIFSMKNTANDYKLLSIRINIETYNPGDVNLKIKYKNIVPYGEFINYEINPISNKNIQPFINSLTIRLLSISGDADLFVSFHNSNPNKQNSAYMSRRSNFIDEVTITQASDKNILDRPIFFSVYGNSRSHYYVEFDYTYKGDRNEYLQTATQIGDNQARYVILQNEEQTGFYSFTPWWTGKENRTVVFFADVIFNKVYFYSDWNNFPQHFLTAYKDQQDTITIYGNEEKYHWTGGRYFIRLRPDFALFDLISQREYIFNMNMFSMTPPTTNDTVRDYEIMLLDREYMGFANQTLLQDYRFFIVDTAAVFDIELEKLPKQGDARFYVKIMDSMKGGLPPRRTNYHFESQKDPNDDKKEILSLNSDQRVSRHPLCASFYSSLQPDNTQRCFIAISVNCRNYNEQCVYKLKIKQKGMKIEDQTSTILHVFKSQPPNPILAEKYVNDYITDQKIRFYYFPIDHTQTNDVMIILNKTQIYGTDRNGDSAMVMNVQQNIFSDQGRRYNYSNWLYPSETAHYTKSQTKQHDQQEIIEVCPKYISDNCNFNVQSCALIVGVIGRDERLSSFRLKGFYGQNKLLVDIMTTNSSRSDYFNGSYYDYFWFTINDTVSSKYNQFDYRVSIGTNKGENPDLFISLMDGRDPTDTDYDLASYMYGSDSIRISSSMNIWEERGWNTSYGVVVGIAVKKEKEDSPYRLLLTNLTKEPPKIQTITVGSPKRINHADSEYKPKLRVFQFYNWMHKDITITLTMRTSGATLMYQKTGQTDYQNNIFTAVPITRDMAERNIDVSAGSEGQIQISGSDCYSCYYFIVVEVQDINYAQYILTISRQDEATSGQFREISVDQRVQSYIGSGSNTKYKFLLTGSESFTLEALIANGQIEMYMGLDPVGLIDNAKKYIWKTTSNNGIGRLEVQSSDDNFYLATYYYIYIKAISDQDVIMSLRLNQARKVTYIENNHDQQFSTTAAYFNKVILYHKSQYENVNEQVKYHVFQVPGKKKDGSSQPFRVNIFIESLTKHFYPTLYLKKQQSNSRPRDISQLIFPRLIDYDLEFGNDPFNLLSQSNYQFTFESTSSQQWVYYTLAVFEHNWGLTDMRKSEYQIRVTADKIDQLSSNTNSNSQLFFQ